MSKTRENTKKLMEFISKKIEAGELDNESLVQLIELSGVYLNLCTLPDYAKQFKMSYNGVKNHRHIIDLFGCRFVVDND